MKINDYKFFSNDKNTEKKTPKTSFFRCFYTKGSVMFNDKAMKRTVTA